MGIITDTTFDAIGVRKDTFILNMCHGFQSGARGQLPGN